MWPHPTKSVTQAPKDSNNLNEQIEKLQTKLRDSKCRRKRHPKRTSSAKKTTRWHILIISISNNQHQKENGPL